MVRRKNSLPPPSKFFNENIKKLARNVFCGINFCDWQNLKNCSELIPHELMPQKIITLGYCDPEKGGTDNKNEMKIGNRSNGRKMALKYTLLKIESI